MTKVSIKVVSVILFVVMIVGFCFAGCDNQYMPTLEQLLPHIQNEFPEAHIGAFPVNHLGELAEEYKEKCSSVIFFFDDESESEYLLYQPVDTPEETARCNFMRLSSVENTKKQINVVMPLLDQEWTDSDADELISNGEPNEDFTDWSTGGSAVFTIRSWGFLMVSDKRGMWIQAMSAT